MKILVTGFEPFGKDNINPSLEVIGQLPAQVEGAHIITIELPTVFKRARDVLFQAIRDAQPDAVFCIGQAGGRAELCMERVAINRDDARIPDNDGEQPIDEIIQRDGEAAYFSTLPIKAIVAAIQEAGIAARVSNTAGTFVCNHVMYQALYLAQTEFPAMKAGFMHIPYLPEQVSSSLDIPTMTLTDMVDGVTIALATIVCFQHKADIKQVGGAIQ